MPTLEEELVLYLNVFLGAFSKGAKRDLEVGCLKVKVAMDILFSFVNNTFILHVCQLRLFTWNYPNGRGRGILFFLQADKGGRKVFI